MKVSREKKTFGCNMIDNIANANEKTTI